MPNSNPTPIDFPQGIQFETSNACNSKCLFCPRGLIQRRQEMPSHLIREIFDQIKTWDIAPWEIKPFLNNEPFLDKRMEWIIPHINVQVPRSDIVIFTNGSCFYSEIIQVMQNSRIKSLHISLNEYRKEHYERLMIGMNFELTMASIDKCLNAHHSRPVAESIIFHRISNGNVIDDEEFKSWCKERLGDFAVCISKMANWKGAIKSNADEKLNFTCVKPYTLTILSNGQVALCCMDYDGGCNFGNMQSMQLLDIYNLSVCKTYRGTHSNNELYPCFLCNGG